MTFKRLIYSAIDPSSKASSKRLILIMAQLLFTLQVICIIIVHTVLLLFIRPLPSVEFYQVMSILEGASLISNLIIILWNIGAIEKVDIAHLTSMFRVMQQKEVEVGAHVVSDAEQTNITTDLIETEVIENVNSEKINEK